MNTEEKTIKIFELDFGETNLLSDNESEIVDWIKNDMESMSQTDTLEYKITIRQMSKKEFEELPEWS